MIKFAIGAIFIFGKLIKKQLSPLLINHFKPLVLALQHCSPFIRISRKAL
jgi:hypothetical protein